MTTLHRPLSRYSFQCIKGANRASRIIKPTSCSQRRAYQSATHPADTPYDETSTAILSAALSHVPQYGFTDTALKLGASSAGYLPISTNLFPRGAYEIINYHLVTQRLALKDRVQFPPPEQQQQAKLGTGLKIRSLLLARLRGNVEVGVVPQWQQALALMAMPSNVPPSLKELARLSDEMWFLAGDMAVDGSWYTKRASLSTVYAASEVFQTQDQSSDFKDTEMFVGARLEEVKTVGGAAANVSEWADFTGRSFLNVLRSKGLRI